MQPVMFSPTALHRSQQLRAVLAREILQNGPLSFARWMAQSLYHPQAGYYCQPHPPMGRSGDFITAPEISPQFAQAWLPSFRKMVAAGVAPVIVELGPGTGAWAVHFIQALMAAQIPWEAYHFIEISPTLQQVQHAAVAAIPGVPMERIHWHAALDFPVEGLIIANEFIDAFPVHLIQKQADTWYECRIDTHQDRLEWTWALLSDPGLIAEVERLQPWLSACPQGYRTEIALPAYTWLAQAWPYVQRGLAFWVDYGYPVSGYYHPQRVQGTLQAYVQHQAVPVQEALLDYPGLYDLTASVDFSGWAQALDRQGWDVCFFVSQAEFLISQGILDTVDPRDPAQIQAVKALTMDLGDSFQILATAKGLPHTFTFPEVRDRAGRL